MRTTKVAACAVVVTFILLLLCSGCKQKESAPEETRLTIIDAAGRVVNIARTPKRVISLQAGTTEILYAIGAGDAVVGVNRTGSYPSDYPPEVGKLPDVGNMAAISVEKVLGLNPDVVFTWAYFIDKAHVLEEKGITVVGTDVLSVHELLSTFRLIGLTMDRVLESQRLADDTQKRIDMIQAKLKDIPEGKWPLVYYEMAEKTAGSGTFPTEIIFLAGGINIYASSPVRYPTPSYEYIIEKNPDVIIVQKVAGKSVEEVKGRKGWQSIKAVQNGRVYMIDPPALMGWGPRTIEGIETIARWLYPALFP